MLKPDLGGHSPIRGKQVGQYYYWHCSLTASQPSYVQRFVELAEQIVGISANEHYNVVKYFRGGSTLSLLWYPGFYDDAFPALHSGWQVDVSTRAVKPRSYAQSFNPPILHRKELFLPPDHPRIEEYKSLTMSAEKLGLFDNVRTIGFRLAWESLLSERGFRVEGQELQPIGNVETMEALPDGADHPHRTVERFRTALVRSNLSAPMQLLARFDFLDGRKSVFDFGCGRGDDIRNLRANGITAAGWDPYYAPNEERIPAHIVNLGFVVNVIENFAERVEAVKAAFALAQELLVVSVMLHNQNSFKGERYEDGVLTSRNTFQKYFTQQEFKGFIDACLDADSIPVAPGIFFVFSDREVEQNFLLGRQRSRANLLRLTQREQRTPRASIRDQRRQERLRIIGPLRERWLALGRAPHKSETDGLVHIIDHFGSLNKALGFLEEEDELILFADAAAIRKNDLLVYFALQAFSRRKPYSHLGPSLQRDIKTFFGGYDEALADAKQLFFQIADVHAIEAACRAAAEHGIGHYDDQLALFVPTEMVERLPALLRAYIGCASALYGDVSSADLVKIHVRTRKLTLMRYDDFYGSPLPKMVERVKINFRTQDFKYFRYGASYDPPYLYLKSKYLHEESDRDGEQHAFDEQLAELGMFDFSGYGPPAKEFDQKLSAARWEICGMQLRRATSIPDPDAQCGRHFTYRQLIHCGETWERTRVDNLPRQADTYNALYDLTTLILEPVIDYFGMMELTYGFCSRALSLHIKRRIAPKLDQHAACELTRANTPICHRLGAAVDFIVRDENMLQVAEWIAVNTPFDRVYYYGPHRPLHVSYGPENARDFIEIREGPSGRHVPYRRSKAARKTDVAEEGE